MYRTVPVTESVDLVLHETPIEIPCKCGRSHYRAVWLIPVLGAVGALFGIFSGRYGFFCGVLLTLVDAVATLVLLTIVAIAWAAIRSRSARTPVRFGLHGIVFPDGRPTIPLDDVAVTPVTEQRLVIDDTRELRGDARAIARALEIWSFHR